MTKTLALSILALTPALLHGQSIDLGQSAKPAGKAHVQFAAEPQVIAATRADIGRVVGQEYVQQFTRAVSSTLGVKRNQGAIDKLKKDLLGGADQ